jgi:hypothetical protein
MADNWLTKLFARVRVGGKGGTISRALPFGGRLTVDKNQASFVTGLSALSQFSADEYWRERNLDAYTLSKISPRKLIELLADVSPDVSKALWDWILFMNPGWEIKAYKFGSEGKTIDKRAQTALDTFINNIHGPYTSDKTIPIDVIFASLFIGMFMRGALFFELVLNETGDLPIDIATPDPHTVSTKKVEEKPRGVVHQLGQWQNGIFVPLDRPTIFYVPVHPFPGRAHGRAPAAAALFSTLFLLGTLHDLRRVVAQQGYPRLDIKVDFEQLKDDMPPDIQGDNEKAAKWRADVVDSIQLFYAKLEPDDAFVHGQAIELQAPLGAMESKFMAAFDGLISAIERQAVRALKSMPLLFGMNEAVAETHANRQWEVHVAGIKSMQHLVETSFDKAFGLSLECQGIQARVETKFAELRAAELMRDAQVKYLEDTIASFRVQQGWITNDEAAEDRVGHKAEAEPERVVLAQQVAANTAPDTSSNPDPGTERFRKLTAVPMPILPVVPIGAEDPVTLTGGSH